MQDKYVKLLLDRCLKVDKNTPLFISYPLIIRPFVEKIVTYANKIGVKDIYLNELNPYEVYYTLTHIKPKDITGNSLFNSHIWDVYAKKNAAFLMLESEIPSLMEDVDSTLLSKSATEKLNTKPIYRDKQLKGKIPWCIACVPNELWAKVLFPKSTKPLEEFWQVLAKITMFDKGNASKNWDNFLKKQKMMEDKLNSLQITKLYYKNKLGTNLEISLSDMALWKSASSDKWLVNIPSYEIFTSPDYTKTNGIVYSSKPLIYNGQTISDFYVKFKDGKVISCKAKVGNDTLKEIINSDKFMGYLGEVALVDYNSPISNTNLTFGTTLIDENASCHIALGSGFLECIKDGNKLSSSKLKQIGLNTSKNHVDFMIGTKDLCIEADTNKGHIIIMKDGNLVL